MAFNVEIENADKLLKKLGSLQNADFSDAITKGCLLVEKDAKLNCPVGTGTLRNSITHTVSGNSGTVGTNVEYAPYVEYGTGLFAANGDGRKDVPWMYRDVKGVVHITSGQHPQPFLKPAFDNNRQRVVELLGKRVEEILKQ